MIDKSALIRAHQAKIKMLEIQLKSKEKETQKVYKEKISLMDEIAAHYDGIEVIEDQLKAEAH